MSKNEKTRPVAATTKRAEETAAFGGAAASFCEHSTTRKRVRQVCDYLLTGAENALDAKTLARLLECDRRSVTQRIERERRRGMPICAAVDGESRGYFLAADADELARYVRALDRRISEVKKTRNACKQTLQGMKKAVNADAN